MKTKIKVAVEDKHIQAARRRDCFNCPVARAVRDSTGFGQVWVGNFAVHLYEGVDYFEGTSFNLTSDVTRRIQHYDLTGEMEPFEFEMELR